MANKPHQQQPGDDWAGLAQNLFGINLEKPQSSDDDLLDDDMFKVEIPKPPAPPPVVVTTVSQTVIQEEIEFATAEPAASLTTRTAGTRPSPVKAALPPNTPPAKGAKADSFGAGIDDFGFGVIEELEAPAESARELIEEEDGLTLPDDYDAEGLTLPSDYDDGLTLEPEAIASEIEEDDEEFEDEDSDDLEASSDSSSDDEFEDDEDESEDEEADEVDSPSSEQSSAETGSSSSSAPRRKRQFRRTREDAYWDMLENWEWEEIPDSDAPRSEGGRSSSSRGRDRKGSGGRSTGDRGRRNDRPREDRAATESRPRSAEGSGSERSTASSDRVRETRAPSDERVRSSERQTTASSGNQASESPRGRSRSPRDDRGRQERSRDDRPRSDARASAAPSPTPSARQTPAPKIEAAAFDDFGLGIFDDEPTTATEAATPHVSGPREEVVAQSTVAADKILKPSTPRTTPIDEELVWPDSDDSDVQLVSVSDESVCETTAMQSAEAADESDDVSDQLAEETSDVTELNEDGTPRRGRRRRRRGRGRRRSTGTGPEAGSEMSEGTTFDLNEALSADGESPDFIPASASDEHVLADAVDTEEDGFESSDSSEQSEGDQQSERRGRRRRRRRRRPTEATTNNSVDGEVSGDSTVSSELGTDSTRSLTEPSVEIHDDHGSPDSDDEEDDEDVPVITYAKMPSWEEAIRYLLNPQLVGKNLDPEDEAESLVGDPRGSGGSEPVAAPPQRRFRRGGGGRGRDNRGGPRSS